MLTCVVSPVMFRLVARFLETSGATKYESWAKKRSAPMELNIMEIIAPVCVLMRNSSSIDLSKMSIEIKKRRSLSIGNDRVNYSKW